MKQIKNVSYIIAINGKYNKKIRLTLTFLFLLLKFYNFEITFLKILIDFGTSLYTSAIINCTHLRYISCPSSTLLCLPGDWFMKVIFLKFQTWLLSVNGRDIGRSVLQATYPTLAVSFPWFQVSPESLLPYFGSHRAVLSSVVSVPTEWSQLMVSVNTTSSSVSPAYG